MIEDPRKLARPETLYSYPLASGQPLFRSSASDCYQPTLIAYSGSLAGPERV